MNENTIQNYQQFNKIKLLTYMTDDIIAFASQKFGQEFYDYMDMNCGAIPEGDYEKVIDPDAPDQFLRMYENIALKRIELVSKKLLESSKEYLKLMEEYFFNQGKKIAVGQIKDVETALEYFHEFILENASMSHHQVTCKNENLISWKKENNESNIYWKLMECFTQGLFFESDFQFTVSDKLEFKICRKLQ